MSMLNRLMLALAIAVGVVLVIFGSMYLLDSPAFFDDTGPWIKSHDIFIDLMTVWSLVVGFFIYGCTKLFSWLTLLESQDYTHVGVSLKRQKLAEAVLGFMMTILYGMTLWSYYIGPRTFDFWDRLWIRLGLFIIIVVSSVLSIQFSYWLRREVYLSGSRKGFLP